MMRQQATQTIINVTIDVRLGDFLDNENDSY